MRTHRKPDLMFVLVVFVSIGIAVSSYIQYAQDHVTQGDSSTPSSNQPVSVQNSQDNQFILVSNPSDTISLMKGDAVNNSLQQP